jgi:pimeloyl-ACP methyl ester carboxylesterase
MLSYGSQEYKLLQGAMRESYVMIVNEHQDSEISSIKNKTLIIYGENDSETPLYMASKFSKKIKNSLLYIVKDCGHFCFTEKPNEVNVLIKEFLG